MDIACSWRTPQFGKVFYLHFYLSELLFVVAPNNVFQKSEGVTFLARTLGIPTLMQRNHRTLQGPPDH
jgi:hypothetical protein